MKYFIILHDDTTKTFLTQIPLVYCRQAWFAGAAATPAKIPFKMQCGVTMNECERSPGRSGLRVNFTEKGEVKERREKFLTAKYGTHQMSLIRKRLAVEMWLYDELQKLFDPPVSRNANQNPAHIPANDCN